MVQNKVAGFLAGLQSTLSPELGSGGARGVGGVVSNQPSLDWEEERCCGEKSRQDHSGEGDSSRRWEGWTFNKLSVEAE